MVDFHLAKCPKRVIYSLRFGRLRGVEARNCHKYPTARSLRGTEARNCHKYPAVRSLWGVEARNCHKYPAVRGLRGVEARNCHKCPANGALIAAYVAAYGGEMVKGVVLEDPPIFSTQGENWENSFAYLDTYKPLHDYISSEQTECWPAYYLRHCYWGELFMKDSMPGIANYAQRYSEKHPGEEVKIFFMPSSVTCVFHYVNQYDMIYGEHFYDLTWNNGIRHEQMLSDIEIPCIYLHAKEEVANNGVYLCAASGEQAQRAVALVGDNCRLIETEDSNHNIHGTHKQIYLNTINSFLKEGME